MQFLSASFNGVVARHQLPSGGASPPSRYDAQDAIYAASFYLCDNGISRGDLHAAIFAYNHADWYVQQVLDQAKRYADAAVGTGDCNAIQATNKVTMTAINYACGQRGLLYVWGGKGAELLSMQHWTGPAHAKNRQVGVRPVVGSSIYFGLSTWESEVRLGRTQRCCVRCNAMGRAVIFLVRRIWCWPAVWWTLIRRRRCSRRCWRAGRPSSGLGS